VVEAQSMMVENRLAIMCVRPSSFKVGKVEKRTVRERSLLYTQERLQPRNPEWRVERRVGATRGKGRYDQIVGGHCVLPPWPSSSKRGVP
jgi:hypothetical protein